MIKYQYQIIKYVHDQFTGEFVNVGVVIYSPDSHFLKAKVANRYSRINSLFPDANGRFILRLLEISNLKFLVLLSNFLNFSNPPQT
ncbi:MAG: DUF3037 domain-containing protein [Bacteroidetes bacterium]|nr:DUF3037 domain-containing protein [Bacteroidota bacterium]